MILHPSFFAFFHSPSPPSERPHRWGAQPESTFRGLREGSTAVRDRAVGLDFCTPSSWRLRRLWVELLGAVKWELTDGVPVQGATVKGVTRLRLLPTMDAFLTTCAPWGKHHVKQALSLPHLATVPEQSSEAHTITRGTLPDLVQLPCGRAQL